MSLCSSWRVYCWTGTRHTILAILIICYFAVSCTIIRTVIRKILARSPQSPSQLNWPYIITSNKLYYRQIRSHYSPVQLVAGHMRTFSSSFFPLSIGPDFRGKQKGIPDTERSRDRFNRRKIRYALTSINSVLETSARESIGAGKYGWRVVSRRFWTVINYRLNI